MCSTTSSKCLCALNAKTIVRVIKKKKTVFIPAILYIFLLLVDANCASDIQTIEQTTPSLINEEYVKVHPFYDKDFPYIYLTINWTYPLNTENLQDLFFEINITKLDNEKCPGILKYPMHKTSTNNITVFYKDAFKIINKCTYKIEIFPIVDEDLPPLIIDYTVPDTADVSNVRAYAFNDEENEDNKGRVKLNVTWDNPTDDIFPMSHSINIYTINCSENARHIEEHYIKPEEKTYIIDTEYTRPILPGCLYKIEVKTEPSNDLEPPSTNYIVPECVGKICSCRYNVDIPTPHILQIKQKTDTIFHITWIIRLSPEMMATHRLTKIIFSLSTTNRIHSDGFIMKQNITNSIANKKQDIEFEVGDIIPGAFYEIRTMVENQHFCISEFDHKSIQAKYFQETPWIYTIAIPLMFIVMCVSFTWIVCRKKCVWIYRKIIRLNYTNQPQIRRIYRSTNTGAVDIRNRLIDVPMIHNEMYETTEIKFEIDPNCLKIGKKIGGGAFGIVFEAEAKGIAGNPGYTIVAVKTIKKTDNTEELEKLLSEILILKQIGRHPNIVTLLGYCTLKQPLMIMEYIPCGDLLQYLQALRIQYEQKGKSFLFTASKNFDASPSIDRQKLSECSYISQPETIPLNRLPSLTETECTELGSDIIEISHSIGGSVGGSSVTTVKPPISPRTPAVLECVLDPKELQKFAIQIARGMEHLERKQIVHRDLAARNVLIDENKTLKISDFGLSRNGIYVNSKKERVPLRWLSIEAMRDNLYSSKSDVWAYGIVLWEIGTLGGFPYPTMNNNEILTFLEKGKRLAKPENCTDELYELMSKCWAYSKDERPSSSEIVEYLETISNKRRIYIDFSQLNPSYVFPPTEEQSNAAQSKSEDNVKIIEIVTNKSDI